MAKTAAVFVIIIIIIAVTMVKSKKRSVRNRDGGRNDGPTDAEELISNMD
jgi:hypothetical protein